MCGNQLLLKARDSIRKIVVYDDVHGTYIGYHYIKFCKNSTCKFRQYYGKHTTDGVELYYDQDWMDNDFFLSTQQTAFSMRLLRNFDSKLLIGQISYNQKANIYNTSHGYNGRPMKTRSAKKGDSEPEIDTAEGDLKHDKRYIKKYVSPNLFISYCWHWQKHWRLCRDEHWPLWPKDVGHVIVKIYSISKFWFLCMPEQKCSECYRAKKGMLSCDSCKCFFQ